MIWIILIVVIIVVALISPNVVIHGETLLELFGGVTKDDRLRWWNPLSMVLWIHALVVTHLINILADDVEYRKVWWIVTKKMWGELGGWPFKLRKLEDGLVEYYPCNDDEKGDD